jgi:methionyl-tRNA formyltransferase
VPPLEALVEAGFDVALVVSQPDKRRGRGSARTPSPVKAAAQAHGIPTTSTLDDALGVGADLGVVVAYGRLIPTPVLQTLPMVNIHFSLLPRWRGAAPVERALLAGDSETGVCLMEVAPELDAGAVYARRIVPIDPRVTLAELQAELVAAGSALLVEELTAGLQMPEPQVGEITYAAKLDADDHQLRFDRPAVDAERVVRLGRAWTWFRHKRLKVLEAEPVPAAVVEAETASPGSLAGSLVATGDGWLRLTTVQPEGKRPMAADDWLNGVRPEPGERLGQR